MRLRKLAISVLVTAALRPAAAITVNDYGDNGPGNCTTTCTLRDALAVAAAGDTIDFDLVPPDQRTIVLNKGPLALSVPVTIAGPGAAWLTLNANYNRLLDASVASTISGVTIIDGLAVGPDGASSYDNYNPAQPGGIGAGGCIRTSNGAALTLLRVSMIDCAAEGGLGGDSYYDMPGGDALGGAIFADGPLTIRDSSITGGYIVGGDGGNSAFTAGPGGSAFGCAVYSKTSDVTISNSTISGCQANGGNGGSTRCLYGIGQPGHGGAARGGALYANNNTTNANVQFSTFANNALVGGAAGIEPLGDPCFPPGGGGTAGAGIYAGPSAHVTITSSVVTANAGVAECYGPVVAQGVNFDQNSTCPGFTLHGSMAHNFQPLSLAPDGTASYYPRYGIVIDAAACGSRTTDQHGATVPIGPSCDLGAVEANYISYIFGDGFE